MLAVSAWLIVGAMIFDMLDGWTARLLNAHSPYGVQMDSLADIINFGWVRSGLSGLKDAGARDLSALMAWTERVGSRPAVKRAIEKLDVAKRDKSG